MSQSGTYGLNKPAPGTVQFLEGDSGGEVGPSGTGVIHITGDPNITTVGDPGTNTVQITLDQNITISGNYTTTGGDIYLPATAPDGSAGVIYMNSQPWLYGSSFFGTNVFVGNAGTFDTTVSSNVGIGQAALGTITSGASENVAIGKEALVSLTSGNENTAIGVVSLEGLLTGNENIAIGFDSGANYSGSESQNIVIGSRGIASENNAIHIGDDIILSATATYIGGIYGTNIGSVSSVVSINSSKQLGETVITGGTGITVTPGANTITISGSGTITNNFTSVTSTPYVASSTDYFLGVATNSLAITIELPNSPATGRTFVIKDSTGNAATNNITVTTVGGAVNIDGSTTYVINSAYQAINVLFDGSGYEIF
jgi:hypothetical protein